LIRADDFGQLEIEATSGCCGRNGQRNGGRGMKTWDRKIKPEIFLSSIFLSISPDE